MCNVLTEIDFVAEFSRLNCSYFREEKRNIIVHQSNALFNKEEIDEFIKSEEDSVWCLNIREHIGKLKVYVHNNYSI